MEVTRAASFSEVVKNKKDRELLREHGIEDLGTLTQKTPEEVMNILGKHPAFGVMDRLGTFKVALRIEEPSKAGIRGIGLPTWMSNLLLRSGIKTVSDVMNKTEEELLRIKGMSPKKLDEVRQTLGKFGIAVKSMEQKVKDGELKITEDTSIEDIGLSNGLVLLLRRTKIKTVGELIRHSKASIRGIRHLTHIRFEEINQRLEKLGLTSVIVDGVSKWVVEDVKSEVLLENERIKVEKLKIEIAENEKRTARLKEELEESEVNIEKLQEEMQNKQLGEVRQVRKFKIKRHV